ncbi:PREDICTED: uncharacterized abhydrolase domain-containing protein DDB_G0269086-like [Brassica oleracea var. oleracea]|uniref:uncharacterized abhydrolase domain-containing protein DDB_G0269086-like n=1 Tax=Brassica oleracea var. oleracea TaxID=109376 RepID=UPI0006A6D617|nr:PREDICTED: uncharacterized abhydrolase domain-containing protein DDB_G0269086-like [Brassica oleracea var. oleracea]
MDGVPDLSALLKGKLQLLSKKSTPANVQASTSSDGDRASKEGAPDLVDEGIGTEPPTSSPKKKKKKSRKSKRRATEELPLEEIASLDETSEDLERRGAAEDPVEINPSEGVSEDCPRKKKRSIKAEPRPSDVEAALVEVVTRDGVSPETPPEKRKVSTQGSDPVTSERSAPDPSARKSSRSEGSIVHGGTKEMLQLEDLYFKSEYIDAASSRARCSEAVIQLGSSEKLAQSRLKAIERVREEHKKANERAAKEKDILRVKFEELEGKLKSAGAARKELTRENTHLEQATINLEKEKAELLEERDAAVEKLIRERQRLRASRSLEVTRERERVEAAMIDKANHCFVRVRDHFTRLEALGKAKNLYGGFGNEEEKIYEAEATKLCVGPLSDSDLTLSPLGLPSRFVEYRFRGSFDPYGLNVNLIRPETASQIITSLEITGEPTEEPLVDVTSVPAEHVEVPEGGDLGEHPENKNLEEVPGKDNFGIGNTPVREEETENVGIEDPVLVSDSSSEGREDREEEDDRVKETSPSQPIEEDPTAAATEDPVGPSALGMPEEVGQDSAP